MTDKQIWQSIAGGAIGGLIGSLAMNQFQAVWSSVSTALSSPNQGDSGDNSSESSEDATVKAAEGISETIFEHRLTDSEKTWAGPAVHYGFGTITGAIYGALGEAVPAMRAGRGAAYGSLVWLLADEIAVPAFGLSPPSADAPLASHVSALAAHLVYGFVTDFVRRIAT